MKLGIMQPYFMPYIGYWQLMNAVDEYVIYDDVNFIKGGWINRNRILVNGEPKYFNVPMLGSSPNLLINEVCVNHDKRIIDKNMRILEGAYKKAPFYDDAMKILSEIMHHECSNIAEYIKFSFDKMADYLGITTKMILSSTLDKDNSLRGQDKVISICKLLGASDYYNAIGGQELYSAKVFEKEGIHLHFIKTEKIEYKQFGNPFQSNLSMIDVMMFNNVEQIKAMLMQYMIMH